MDGRKFLKIKAKSLAEESRIIRKEERKTKGDEREQLHLHRIFVVRPAARATHLAYGLIRGRTREQIEGNHPIPLSTEFYLVKAVSDMVKKYGDPGVKVDVGTWIRSIKVEKENASV